MAATPTIVLVPVWGIGHFVPMLEVGKRLLARSALPLTVTVLVMPLPAEAKRASEITEHIRQQEASGLAIRFHHLPAVEPPTDHSGIEEYISRYVQLYSPHVKAAVAGLTCPVAGVVVDIFCTALFDAAHQLGVPAYVYLITSAAMCALLLRSPTLDEEVAVEVEFEQMEGGVDVPGLPPVPASCLPTGLENRKIPTYRWFLYNGRRYMEAAGIIVNTIAEAEPRVLAAIADGRCTRGVPAPPVYSIGPVIPSTPPAEQQAQECVRWLDSQPPSSVVFLCFGSGGCFTAPQAHEIAHGLDRSGHRFLWVLRGTPEPGTKLPSDGNLAELLPADFLARTKDRGLVWPTKAPQKEILAHAAVGGFVTHCGWNSVLESLWHGVPMVPWPLGAEQHYNAFTLVADMGVAVALNVERKRKNFVEATELERAVKALMCDGETARKVRDKVMEIKAACRKAMEEGGSSNMSLQRLCDALVEGAVHPGK
ncbi:Anthocyanidin 5,3-O-glucosyltransferase [Zea mays]|jgi:hypothetical protein|uniref:Malvidin galactosylase UGT88C3 n=2 Tax=Zea mays TaxID=4577 RepID=B6THM4_MAIZE|nr:Anthocyanidin 5,3-O-glucosyltransferase [Zea mays]ACF79979.2 unknown [Zea mays]ACG36607.1 anthocyanidin 3-O-glucosyltransferase [Zea mays]ACN26979.1 unknown [Zea mays]ACN29010.1 unknown [Zea mays]ACN33348.1 unknown [Zea mays]|eukprot:NP_001131537.2 uncharacterized protein LOC100192877 [Zea mays]